MQPESILESVPIAFIKRCLEKNVIRVRQRWAVMVLNLWIKHGWAHPLGDGCFQLTLSGKISLQSYLLKNIQPDFESLLTTLNISLPENCNQYILSELKRFDPEFSEQQLIEHNIQLVEHRYLSFRTVLPCSLFLSTGELMDISSSIRAWQQFVIPEMAAGQVIKWLWQSDAPQEIITVDDYHVFSCISLKENQLIIHAPHQYSDLAEKMITSFTHEVVWAHLCDLTPLGLNEASQIAKRIQRPLRLYLPENWMDFLRKMGVPLTNHDKWPYGELSRELQVKLDFLLGNNQFLSQRVFAYAQKWSHDL